MLTRPEKNKKKKSKEREEVGEKREYPRGKGGENI